MKHKFSLIWRVAVVLVLVLSFSLVAAVPVSAASVSQPSVIVTTKTITTASAYTITFDVTTKLALDTDWIEVRFPYDTTVPADYADNTITISYTGGIGGGAELAAVDVGDDATFPATRTVRIALVTTPLAEDCGSGATVQVIFLVGGGTINPSAVGDYTLEVRTSTDTTWKTSASYSLEQPAVHIYNAAGTWVNSFPGADALDVGNAGAYYDKAFYTIEVGPGTYAPSSTITLTGNGLTFKGANYGVSPVTETRGAESIINATGIGVAINILSSNVTVEGFTVHGSSGSGILIEFTTTALNTEGVTIKNNIISDTGNNGVCLAAKAGGGAVVAETTISGNLIEDCNSGICVLEGANYLTISNNMITGSKWTFDGAIVFDLDNDNNTITGNILTDNLGSGIVWDAGATSANNLVKGNTISGNAGKGIWVWASAPTKLVITDNDVTDNTGVGILIEAWAVSDVVKFNNITGNDTINGYGLKNTSGAGVDATHNWWGTAVSSEIAAMINNTGVSTTDYTPFLSDTVDAVFSATAVDTSVAALDAKTAVGVKVSGAAPDAETFTDIIGVGRYVSNPVPDTTLPFTPIANGFFDVYVYEATDVWIAADEVVLKFYDSAITNDSVVWTWDSSEDAWKECTLQGYSSAGGAHMWVKVHAEVNTTAPTIPVIESLTELVFAVSGEEVEEPFDPIIYDEDEDGVMEIAEVLNAIVDYFAGDITITEVLEVITLYF